MLRVVLLSTLAISYTHGCDLGALVGLCIPPTAVSDTAFCAEHAAYYECATKVRWFSMVPGKRELGCLLQPMVQE